MRRAIGILALAIIGFGISPRTASADGVVNYTVTGTYATGDAFSATSLSRPGDSFLFTFSVDPAALPPGPVGGPSVSTPIAFDYTDSLGGSTIFSLTGEAGIVTFYTMGDGGLFDIDFDLDPSNHFVLQAMGFDPGFFDGTTLTLNTGNFTITPGPTSGELVGTGSLFGDQDTGNFNAISGNVSAVPAMTVPEPSSILLLGSGFFVLVPFARRRLRARNC